MLGIGVAVAIALLAGCFSEQKETVSNDKLLDLQSSLSSSMKAEILDAEKKRIMAKAVGYINAPVQTVTANIAQRSQGGINDFYSEGDYWWPDPANPNAPYKRRDGESNPNNFLAHRKSIMRFSDIAATLSSAYILTEEQQYADAALRHLLAWFVNPNTKMNPSLLYGQAIKGRHTGRSIGIIDTIHLVEVAKSIEVLAQMNAIPAEELVSLKAWFSTYLNWLNTHEYGTTEKNHPNNHGITWSMQASAFARVVGDKETLSWVRKQFKQVYLKEMMNAEGGFDAELARTKPYGYSLFVLDALAGVAELASTDEDDLWLYEYTDENGGVKSMAKGLAFIVPYIEDKTTWPYAQDIQYWDDWPVRHIALFLGAKHFDNESYFQLYNSFDADSTTYEVIRNLPIRHPLIWM